jgi:hypothetical protein
MMEATAVVPEGRISEHDAVSSGELLSHRTTADDGRVFGPTARLPSTRGQSTLFTVQEARLVFSSPMLVEKPVLSHLSPRLLPETADGRVARSPPRS